MWFKLVKTGWVKQGWVLPNQPCLQSPPKIFEVSSLQLCAGASSSGQTRMGGSSSASKKKKNGLERKYLSIQCTGYLKSWPVTKVGLQSDYSDTESVDDGSMSCLVAVARLQPSFNAAVEDCVERGQRTAHGVEFTSRHGTDGKFCYVDQRVTLILGYTPQV